MSILDFGSANIDHLYKLDHLVREGETIASLSYEQNEGGKGLNQAVALSKAGAEVFFAGAIGRGGRHLLDFFASFGVDTRHVSVLDGPTGHAIIQVDTEGRNSIILHGGANREITPAMIDDVLAHFGTGDTILLQNEISNLEYLLRAAKARGLQVALNPSPITDSILAAPLALVDWFLLNEIEGADITGRQAPDDILDGLLAAYPTARIVLTLGTQGSMYADAHMRLHQEAILMECVDTTAAGDTFTGYFLQSALSGEPVDYALKRAAYAAALAVGRTGAGRSIPYAQEVSEAMKE